MFHIVKQRVPWGVGRGVAGEKHIIDARPAMERGKAARSLAQAAAGPVADDGIANLLGGGEADARRGVVRRRPAPGLCAQMRAPGPDALGDILELGPLPQLADGLSQAERRLRPLARRRDSTFVPFLVAMRARKPWRRLRTSRLG